MTYQGAYQALFDDINANGGINGRKIEATYAPASPVGTEASAAACAKLTQDDPSFVVMGSFVGDAALCYVDTQQTALIGGTMTAESLAKAKAPWYSTWASDDLATDTTQKMLDKGLLDGKFAVVGRSDEKASIEATTLKVLQDAGKEPAETAYVTSPSGDATALNAEIATVAERLKSEGVDTVVLAGDTIGNQWLTGAVKTSYRPKLLFMQTSGVDAFAITPGNDLSILDGVIGGSVYPAAEGAGTAASTQTKDCFAIQEKAGIVIQDPATLKVGDVQQYQPSLLACQQVELLQQILEKAGTTLNYGTFEEAGNSLKGITLSGSPDAWNYGAPPSADGDPPSYLLEWNPTTKRMELAGN